MIRPHNFLSMTSFETLNQLVTVPSVLSGAELVGGGFVEQSNTSPGADGLKDSVESGGPRVVSEVTNNNNVLITSVAVVNNISVGGSFVEVCDCVFALGGSHIVSEIASPFLTTTLPQQLQRNRERGQRSELQTAEYKRDYSSLTLCEADSGQQMKMCQRTSH